uniref:Uncharacterized protein n=1 Tax=Arundo donax TaxID=35708 RepID=A0A0A9FX43_ARUDO
MPARRRCNRERVGRRVAGCRGLWVGRAYYRRPLG